MPGKHASVWTAVALAPLSPVLWSGLLLNDGPGRSSSPKSERWEKADMRGKATLQDCFNGKHHNTACDMAFWISVHLPSSSRPFVDAMLWNAARPSMLRWFLAAR